MEWAFREARANKMLQFRQRRRQSSSKYSAVLGKGFFSQLRLNLESMRKRSFLQRFSGYAKIVLNGRCQRQPEWSGEGHCCPCRSRPP